MTQDIIGRYEIESELGRGGMATVYLAFDPRFRRKVAIKLVSINLQTNQVFRERFEREAQLIARIEHPAIVPVYDYGEEQGQPYLVMRYMSGGTLTGRIKDGPLPVDYASQIITKIAPALDAVHAQGIVHRDLKPANILLDGFGNPAISDFGIAHFTQATVDLTGSAVIGTPSYMSPEQVRGDEGLDGRSDVYALGVILFEMLNGIGPFRASTPLSVAMKHLTDPVPSILSTRPDLPSEIDSILRKSMAKDRELRYPSASELATELRAVTDTAKQDAIPVPHPIRVSQRDDMATEIDTAEESVAPSQLSKAEQPVTPKTTGPVKRPKQFSMPRIAGMASVVLCVLLACGSLSLLGVWSKLGLPNIISPATQTATVVVPSPSTATSAPVPPEVVLLVDDFSDPASGWPTIQNDRGGYSYRTDGYHIIINEMNSALWAMTSSAYDNSSVSVDARPMQADMDGYYGLLCRAQDDRNFYYFVIRNTGEYTIGKYINAEFQSLLTQGWIAHNAIRPGAQTNRIDADCSANTLKFSVNGVMLNEIMDTDFTSGFSGILAASLDSQGFEVRFNEFRITQPTQ